MVFAFGQRLFFFRLRSMQETECPAAGNGGAGTERIELLGEVRKLGIQLGAGLWEQLCAR